uniref:Rhodanese domain-containing protein n=1 Tax=Eutreptiella gymnastica TaxID=73025 RepID=A0A7S4FI46_9EUGL
MVETVKRQVLEDHLLQPEHTLNLVVVDVRGRDFVGGHIFGALHIPHTAFRPEKLHALLAGKGTPQLVVFHCMYSRLRAPVCAEVYLDFLGKQKTGDCRVAILEGGFSGWLESYVRHPKREQLVQDFDSAQWSCIGGAWEHITDCPWAAPKAQGSADLMAMLRTAQG